MTDTLEATRAAFLRDILARPEDDAPRLILADWLEEHGEEMRAELIRLQCMIAPIRAACLCGECVKRKGGGQHHNGKCAIDPALNRRVRELLYRGGDAWAQWPADAPEGKLLYTFVRGFVECVEMPGDTFVEHADALLAQHPIREVTLTSWPYVSLNDRCFLTKEGLPCHRPLPEDDNGPLIKLLKLNWPGIRFHLPPSPGI